MKKRILLVIFFCMLNLTYYAQTWTHLNDRGTPIASHYLGDYLTQDIYFAINQSTLDKTVELGIGKTTNGGEWTWYPAVYDHTAGSDNWWKYTANTIQFTSTGNWYYSGQFIMPTIYYASKNWAENVTILSAESYFTVSAIPAVTNPTADNNDTDPNTKIDLSWTSNGIHWVMIVRKTSTQAWSEPTQGSSYSAGNNIGDCVVVYKGAASTFTDEGLDPNTTYNYKFYSENQNYYSTGVEASSIASLPVEIASISCSVDKNLVNLKWSTATEVNNYGFAVERFKRQGTRDEVWEKIGFVQGHGNSNSPKNYSFTDSSPLAGKVQYRLKQIDFDGKFEYSPIIEVELELPASFSVQQNFPNPFNPTTTIKYELPENSFVSIKVYDSIGRELKSLMNQYQGRGLQQVIFDASGLTSGIYYYTINAGNYSATRKMLLIK